MSSDEIRESGQVETNIKEALEQRLKQAQRDMTIQVYGGTFSSHIAKLEAAANDLIKVVTDDAERLSIRRSVAFSVFLGAYDREVPLNIFREVVNRRIELGFYHIVHKCDMFLLFARHCIKQGSIDEAEVLLRDAEKELETFIASDPKMLSSYVDNTLSRIKKELAELHA